MPIFEFVCDNCGFECEELNKDKCLCSECGVDMRKKMSSIALVKVRGKGYPSRRKWMENWTPDSPKFHTGSLHGEKY